MSVYILSVEPVGRPTYIHGFHLGTDEAVARERAEDFFRHPPSHRCPDGVVSVALKLDDRLVDVYYSGEWDSQRDWSDAEDGVGS